MLTDRGKGGHPCCHGHLYPRGPGDLQEEEKDAELQRLGDWERDRQQPRTVLADDRCVCAGVQNHRGGADHGIRWDRRVQDCRPSKRARPRQGHECVLLGDDFGRSTS